MPDHAEPGHRAAIRGLAHGATNHRAGMGRRGGAGDRSCPVPCARIATQRDRLTHYPGLVGRQRRQRHSGAPAGSLRRPPQRALRALAYGAGAGLGYDAAARVVAQAVARFGRIDIDINSAGYSDLGSFEDTTIDSFRTQVDTNFYGVVNVTKAVVPFLHKQGNGHIFQVSSLSVRWSAPGMTAYQAAKWAVAGFSIGLAQEIAPFGVQVTVLEPGGMRTDWAGSSMTIPLPSAPYQPTIGAFAELVRAASGRECPPSHATTSPDPPHIASIRQPPPTYGSCVRANPASRARCTVSRATIEPASTNDACPGGARSTSAAAAAAAETQTSAGNDFVSACTKMQRLMAPPPALNRPRVACVPPRDCRRLVAGADSNGARRRKRTRKGLTR